MKEIIWKLTGREDPNPKGVKGWDQIKKDE